MASFWQYISHLGTRNVSDRAEIKHVIIANRINLILALLSQLLILAIYITFGFANSIPIMLGGQVVYLAVFIINGYGLSKVGRTILAFYVSIASLGFTIATIVGREVVTSYIYYEGKVLILSAVLIPLLIFSSREKISLFLALLVNFICLAGFDFILEQFNAGYFERVGNDEGYNLAHFVFVLCYIFITLSILFLKNLSTRYEKKSEGLISELGEVNKALKRQNIKLTQLNTEIEQRNEEIISQTEEIGRANKKIREQQKLLESTNISLESEVRQKNVELLKTNDELKDRNQELEQFSFALSHNLRSPLTSLMGLTKLFKADKENRDEIVDRIGDSVIALEEIIQGLGSILSMNYADNQTWEEIIIEKEIQTTWNMLSADREKVALHLDLKEEKLETIKPYFKSILYNLLSNAVKYRSQEKPEILVRSNIIQDYFMLEVIDNGLGFDTTKHRDQVFKLYKRFHEGIPGNGIGLYLIKKQIELMKGELNISSKVNEGTKVFVKLPVV